MTTPWAILAGALLIASAILFSHRWEIGVAAGQVYRLDRWTGTVVSCNWRSSDGGNLGMFVAGSTIPCERP